MCNMELWSGFLGTIVGAIIGGLIALKIALLQINQQKKRLDVKEQKEVYEKEIQLLWQIFFDIKKDSENTNIWEKYNLLLNGNGVVAKFIYESLEIMLEDLRDYFKLLSEKSDKLKNQNMNELEQLWQRSLHYLNSLCKIKDELVNKHSVGTNSKKIEAYYKELIEIYQKHTGNII